MNSECLKCLGDRAIRKIIRNAANRRGKVTAKMAALREKCISRI